MARTKCTIRPAYRYKHKFIKLLKEVCSLYKARGDAKQAEVVEGAIKNISSCGAPDTLTRDFPGFANVGDFVNDMLMEYIATGELDLIYELSTDEYGLSGSFKSAVRECFDALKFKEVPVPKDTKITRRGVCCILRSGTLVRRSVMINIDGVKASHKDVYNDRWELFEAVKGNRQEGFLDKLKSHTPRDLRYKEFRFRGEEHSKGKKSQWDVNFTSADDFNPRFVIWGRTPKGARKPVGGKCVSGKKELVWELINKYL
jgi:hypothetical protein